MTYTVEGGAGSYHDYDLVYDPVAGSADLFVDGVEVLSDYMGFPRDLNRVLWGAGQSSSTGHAYWNKAWFGIGECRGGCCIGGGTPGTPAECIVTTQAICEAQNNLYLGDDQPCDEVDCYPLLVTMEAFSAEATKDGVLISWTTASEIDTAGFRVLRGVPARGEKAATLEPISPLIPSAGNSLESASYSFLDNAKQAATAEYYYIEDLDIFGKVTRHGPIVVERNQPSPRGWKVDLKR